MPKYMIKTLKLQYLKMIFKHERKIGFKVDTDMVNSLIIFSIVY